MARIKYYDSASNSWKYADTNITSTEYVLPVGGNELGGVKNGGNVTINSDGTMTAPIVDIIEVDTTLSVSGKAADAKAVGDALSLKADQEVVDEVVGELENHKSIMDGLQGQINKNDKAAVKTVNGAKPDANGNVNISVTAPDESIVVDPTLSQGGMAADAAVVGHNFKRLSAELADLPKGFSGSWNDLTDKPFYEELAEVIIPEKVLISGATFTGNPIVVGKTYNVIVDGVQHQVECAATSNDNVVCL